MRQTLRILPYVAFVFAGVLGGAATQSAKKDTGVSKGTVYACALLTPAEIEAIQGERVEETKSTVRPSGGLFATQCLFRTPTLNKSVSLFLTASDPLHPVPLTARQLWQKQFHSSEVDEEPVAGENKKKLDPERKRESREPCPIRGLGEEAYWVASPVASALYVLKGEMFLRISVGSAGQESERMEKSKALARAVLKRL
ncbi:MAG: hypothetical protein AUH11_11960 [Acidobacteria bacterium 13_2_20CM_57_17]|nr:MAG: hypothetical protein AUH11_11960 [Acidobacteria bacterium 13_2_20CM_57_17]